MLGKKVAQRTVTQMRVAEVIGEDGDVGEEGGLQVIGEDGKEGGSQVIGEDGKEGGLQVIGEDGKEGG